MQQKLFPAALALGLVKPEAHGSTQLQRCPTNLSGISTNLVQGCFFSKPAGSIPDLASSCVQSQQWLPGAGVGYFVFACTFVCACPYAMHGLSVKYVSTYSAGNKN